MELQDTIIPISYNADDCNELSAAELINDICDTLKQKLTEEIINKPVKCNIVLVYTSLINSLDGDNDSKGMGFRGQQS